jgi:uncharacterized Tic20 family protein
MSGVMSVGVVTLPPSPEATPTPGACGGAHGPCTPAPATPRLRDEATGESDRNYAVAIHLTPLLGMVFGPLVLTPLVLWLIRKDESVFVDDHGREVINFGISFVLLHLILAVTVVGVVLWPVLWIVGIINLIRGAVAAGSSEYFRYPLTIRFIT